MMQLARTFFAALAVVAALAAPAAAQDFTPTRFSVNVVGQGPDVILIPGLGSSRDVWSAEATQLSATHRVHLVQLAGFAGAPAAEESPEAGAVLAPFVEELDAYIQAQRLDRPAIIGHSMGGLAGLMLARVRPQSVGRLMVVDALPFFSVLFDRNATAERMAEQGAAMSRQIVEMTPGEFARMQRFGIGRLVRNDARREEVVGWTLASDRATFAQAMYEVMTSDMRGEIGAIETPLTVVYAYDAAMGAEAEVDALYHGAYAPAPHARLVRIDEARHFLMLDQPEAFHAAVAAFLS